MAVVPVLYVVQSWQWFSFAVQKSRLQTEAACLFLPLLVSVPSPAAAATILLWQREENEFIVAAADVKWRAPWRVQNRDKWVRGPHTKGQQLTVNETGTWGDRYPNPNHPMIMKCLDIFRHSIIYIAQHVRDV